MASPGADKEANWLPAPNDAIYLVMRLHWLKTAAPSILPVDKRGVATARYQSGAITIPDPPMRGAGCR